MKRTTNSTHAAGLCASTYTLIHEVLPSPTPESTDTPVPPTPTPTDTPIPTDTPTPTSLPTPTVPPDIPPRSVLEENESWQQNGIRPRLDDVRSDAPRECVTLMFNLFNDTDHAIIVAFDSESFTVVDSLDRKWRLSSIGPCTYGCSGRNEEMADIIEAGERFRAEGCGTWRASLHTFLTDTAVDEIIATVNVSQVANARWRIPIHN